MALNIYTNSNGIDVPSVTTIIKILNKKGIVEWSNYLGFKHKGYKKTLDEYALRGSILHDNINKYFTGSSIIPFIDQTIEKEVDTLFQHFLSWIKTMGITCSHTEFAIAGDTYGGTIDFLGKSATIGDNKTILADFKTSKKVQSTHFIQLGGYLNLLEDKHPDIYSDISRCQIVLLNAKGLTVAEKTIDEMLTYQSAFKMLAAMYHVFDDLYRKDWGESVV